MRGCIVKSSQHAGGLCLQVKPRKRENRRRDRRRNKIRTKQRIDQNHPGKSQDTSSSKGNFDQKKRLPEDGSVRKTKIDRKEGSIFPCCLIQDRSQNTRRAQLERHPIHPDKNLSSRTLSQEELSDKQQTTEAQTQQRREKERKRAAFRYFLRTQKETRQDGPIRGEQLIQNKTCPNRTLSQEELSKKTPNRKPRQPRKTRKRKKGSISCCFSTQNFQKTEAKKQTQAVLLPQPI